MAMQVLIIIQMAGSNFLVFYSNTGVSKLLLYSWVDADLGFTKRSTLSIESLKQGIWGAQPLRSYRVFSFVSY